MTRLVKIDGGGTFEPNPAHIYRNAGGFVVPSATEAIRAQGLAVDLSGANPRDIERAGIRGDHIHLALLFALEGDLDWRNLDSKRQREARGEIKPVVRAGVRCLEEAGFQLVRAESHGISALYQYGFTPDLEGILYGADAVIDAKSGSSVPLGATGLQLSGYALGIAERRKISRRPKRYCLRLFPDRGEARLIPVETDPYEDEADFLAAVRCWHRQNRTDLRREMR